MPAHSLSPGSSCPMPVLSYGAELHEMLIHVQSLQDRNLSETGISVHLAGSSHPSHSLPPPWDSQLGNQHQHAAGGAPRCSCVLPAPSRAPGAHTGTRAAVLPPSPALTSDACGSFSTVSNRCCCYCSPQYLEQPVGCGKAATHGESPEHTVQLTPNTDQTQLGGQITPVSHRWDGMGWALPKEGQGSKILKYSGLELHILRSPF